MLIFGYRHSQSALKRVQMKTISHLICKITYTFLCKFWRIFLLIIVFLVPNYYFGTPAIVYPLLMGCLLGVLLKPPAFASLRRSVRMAHPPYASPLLFGARVKGERKGREMSRLVYGNNKRVGMAFFFRLNKQGGTRSSVAQVCGSQAADACCILPSRITTTRSLSVSASSWSCVT